MHDVAVLYDIVFALDAHLAGGTHGRLGLERKLAYFLQPPGGYEPETSVLYLS